LLLVCLSSVCISALIPPHCLFPPSSTTELYTLSLHDALPISRMALGSRRIGQIDDMRPVGRWMGKPVDSSVVGHALQTGPIRMRSEEHTSELQSRENLVCRLLLEKKNKPDTHHARGSQRRLSG